MISRNTQLCPNRTPLTETQARAKTVGDLQPLSDTIQLVEYDAEWPTVFGREVEMARLVLDRRALRIEHVGSTSVSGLPAKPIIDILLVVVDSADEDAYVPSLDDAGYVLRIREPDWHSTGCSMGQARRSTSTFFRRVARKLIVF